MTWRSSGLLTLIGIGALALIAGCEKGEAKPAAADTKQVPGTPVVAAVAVAKDVPVYLDEIGRTTARERDDSAADHREGHFRKLC